MSVASRLLRVSFDLVTSHQEGLHQNQDTKNLMMRGAWRTDLEGVRHELVIRLFM